MKEKIQGTWKIQTLVALNYQNSTHIGTYIKIETIFSKGKSNKVRNTLQKNYLLRTLAAL